MLQVCVWQLLPCMQAYAVDNKLVVSYACTPAWG